MVSIALLTVKLCSEFQVNIFSNNRDMSKVKVCQADTSDPQGQGNTSTFCHKTAELKIKDSVNPAFSPFPTVFRKPPCQGRQKSGLCEVKSS